ncbi:MAG: ASKHA domain-containing protein [Anaerolineaceae bacterium]
MSETKLIVDFEPIGKRVEVKPGTTLSEAARQAGLPLTMDCGGSGSCGQCRINARDQENLSKANPVEENLLTEQELATGYRLACQTSVFGNVKIDVPATSMISGQRLQVESAGGQSFTSNGFEDLVVQSYTVTVPKASLHDLRSDLERVLDGLNLEFQLGELNASPAAVRSLSVLLRKHNWQVQVLVRQDQIVGFLAPDVRPTGLAVDLGTTKIAAYLVDLSNGETLASEGMPNPQIGYGEDVISRMGYVIQEVDGAKVLSQAVYATLGELAQLLSERAGTSLTQIAEVCIVGNSVMMHLLMEMPVKQLAMAPYISATAKPQEGRAADLGLRFLGDCRVYIPPLVAGYVGADLVAMTLASEIGQDDRTVMGIDIGTNTEIVLSIHGKPRLVSLSCASGPAFEGAHIRAGMRAAAGAIERIILGAEKPKIQTIEGALPLGICGSGIIDAIAELHRVGAINASGRFVAGMPRVRKGQDGLEYLLVDAEDTVMGEEIVITQNDVNEIQYAKGAIMAGITVLLEVGGIQAEDLDEIVLAGAFGSFLNLDSAISMGLLPKLPLNRYRQVGNAAGEGARQMLVSKAMRARAVELTRRIDYIELTIYPSFSRIYARSMRLEN